MQCAWFFLGGMQQDEVHAASELFPTSAMFFVFAACADAFMERSFSEAQASLNVGNRVKRHLDKDKSG